MAPTYKLTYFDARGLAETSRFLMKYGGIDFEDCRIKRQEWLHWKPKFPFGQVPVLEHEGKVVGQSIAIWPNESSWWETTWENLEIDAIVDTINDLCMKFVAWFYDPDETKKRIIIENIKKDSLPYYMPRLEEIVKKNKGFLALGRLTWADFYWATVSQIFDAVTGIDTLASYPELKAARES